MNEFENQVLRHTWYLYCLLIWFHTSLEGPKSSISVHHKPNSFWRDPLEGQAGEKYYWVTPISQSAAIKDLQVSLTQSPICLSRARFFDPAYFSNPTGNNNWEITLLYC